jgi:hypothetical protein
MRQLPFSTLTKLAQGVSIDTGGLFKEFWTDLSAVAFNQNYALFQ